LTLSIQANFEKEEHMGAIRDFEVAFNRYLDEENATFEDAQRLFNQFQTCRVMTEKARRDAANRKAEAEQQAEQERSDAEKATHLDRLRQQYRDAK
jgi:hypothetical protein